VAVVSSVRPELRESEPGRRTSGKRVGRRLTPYLLLAPALLVMLAFCYPIIFLVSFSFQHYGLDEFSGAPVKFAGLDNYRAVFKHPEFVSATVRTVVLAVAIVSLTLVCGTIVALVMQRIDRFTRTVLVTGLLVVVGYIWASVWWFQYLNHSIGLALTLVVEFGVTLGSVAVLGYAMRRFFSKR